MVLWHEETYFVKGYSDTSTLKVTSVCIHTKRNSQLINLLSTGKKRLASQFNLTYRYIDDVNNPEFEIYLGQMYPAELEIKDTTESITSASYLDFLMPGFEGTTSMLS